MTYRSYGANNAQTITVAVAATISLSLNDPLLDPHLDPGMSGSGALLPGSIVWASGRFRHRLPFKARLANDIIWSKGASRHFSLFEPEDVLQMAILAIGE